MPYNARTGVTTAIKIVRALCKLLDIYGVKIRAWVTANAGPVNTPIVLAWLDGAGVVCAILQALPDD